MNSPTSRKVEQLMAASRVAVAGRLEWRKASSNTALADPTSSLRFAGQRQVTHPSPSMRLGRCGTGPHFLSHRVQRRCKSPAHAPTEGKIGCGSETSAWRWLFLWGWQHVVTPKDRARFLAQRLAASARQPLAAASHWASSSAAQPVFFATTSRRTTASKAQRLNYQKSSAPAGRDRVRPGPFRVTDLKGAYGRAPAGVIAHTMSRQICRTFRPASAGPITIACATLRTSNRGHHV